MSLFVDTSVWSLAFRRDAQNPIPEVVALTRAIEGGEPLISTGLVLQELLQGFSGPKLPILQPDRQDHVEAAELRATSSDARACK